MPELIVTDRTGTETSVDSPADRTVMEVIRDAGFDDMLAFCGGCCSCATCHVFVDPEFADQLPPIPLGHPVLRLDTLSGGDARLEGVDLRRIVLRLGACLGHRVASTRPRAGSTTGNHP